MEIKITKLKIQFHVLTNLQWNPEVQYYQY